MRYLDVVYFDLNNSKLKKTSNVSEVSEVYHAIYGLFQKPTGDIK